MKYLLDGRSLTTCRPIFQVPAYPRPFRPRHDALQLSPSIRLPKRGRCYLTLRPLQSVHHDLCRIL